ncbi:MAG: hypothetical protein ACI9LO_001013 [Planctomycetota bacterium]|jgi:hypothetical protein
MHQSKRIQLREQYMQGWYKMDPDLLVAATAVDFRFEDPAEPLPIDRSMLPEYMLRWKQRTEALGSNNQWRLSYETRQDSKGVLTDWEWWELIDTDLQGAAIVLTTDNGVLLERITYFEPILRQASAKINS